MGSTTIQPPLRGVLVGQVQDLCHQDVRHLIVHLFARPKDPLWSWAPVVSVASHLVNSYVTMERSTIFTLELAKLIISMKV